MPGLAIRSDKGRFNARKIPTFVRISFLIAIRIIVNLK